MKQGSKDKIVLIIIYIGIMILAFLGLFECPFKKFYHIYCVGCGSTRMAQSLLKLDFYQAFRFNPLMFISLILIILYGIYVLVCKLIKKDYYKPKTKFWYVVLIITIIYMILRNIPYFSFLTPTYVR